jgi:hypothetical protein
MIDWRPYPEEKPEEEGEYFVLRKAQDGFLYKGVAYCDSKGLFNSISLKEVNGFPGLNFFAVKTHAVAYWMANEVNMPEEKPEPKACPMRDCGSTDVHVVPVKRYEDCFLEYMVACKDCGARNRPRKTIEDAVRAWNGEG